MKVLNCLCLTLVIIGAINWGLVGFFTYNLIDALFGAGGWFSRVIYGLVGLAGLYLITFYGYVCSDDN